MQLIKIRDESRKKLVNIHLAYHAHIYFDEKKPRYCKAALRANCRTFCLACRPIPRKIVGPHPCWSCQVSFEAKDFETYLLWLDEHRRGLKVLVHGLSGDVPKDHSDYAYWLGEEVPLNLDDFSDRWRG